MDREKQIKFERCEIAEIISSNFDLNGEKYDASDFEWSAQCVQMAGYRKADDVAREIFEEIENCMSCFEDDDDGYLLKKCEFEFFMRELKKEYTEESENDR